MGNVTKSILLLSMVLAVLLCANGVAAATDIRSWDDLDFVRENLEGEYILTVSLDFSEYDGSVCDGYWIPIGTNDEPFTGIFDGNGFTISNLILINDNIVENEDVDYLGDIGFFGVADGATISNLTLENVMITIDEENAGEIEIIAYIGLLAGKIDETNLINCHVNGEINISATGTSEIFLGGIGGMVGNSYSDGNIIENCSSEGLISIETAGGMSLIGGLAGIGGPYLIIENCYSAMKIDVNALRVEDVGGIVGVFGGYMNNCYAPEDITVTAETAREIGGIVGLCMGAEMSNCYVTGDIIVKKVAGGERYWVTHIGGIVGCLVGEMYNCYALNEMIEVNFDFDAEEADFVGRIIGSCEFLFGPSVEPVAAIAPLAAGPEVAGSNEPINYYWSDMKGKFTYEWIYEEPIFDVRALAIFLEEPIYEGPIASSAVWNKLDWIKKEIERGGIIPTVGLLTVEAEDVWKLNDYEDFKLPVFVWQQETLVADASHLKPSSGGGNGTGQAIVVDPTNQTNPTNPDALDSGNNGNSPNGDNTPPAPDTSTPKAGPNWWLLALLLTSGLVIVVIAYWFYQKGKT